MDKQHVRKAMETLLIDKENFESYIDDTLAHKLTDEEWEKICDALDDSVAEYLDMELVNFVHDYKYEKGIQ
jgi:Ca2+-binding EF-hand superfamily protein